MPAAGMAEMMPISRVLAPASCRRNDTSGKLVVWYMDSGGVRSSGVFTSPDAPADAVNWAVAGPR